MFKRLKRLINRIPGMHYHDQNLAREDRATCKRLGKPYRGAWLSWRGWIYFGEGLNRQIAFEYATGTSPGISLEVCPSERELKFHVSIWFFSWWLTFTRFLPSFLYPKGYDAKEISFCAHSGSFWISLWTSTMSWKKGDWSWSFNPVDFLLGRMDYSEEPVEEKTVDLALPERIYNIEIKRYWGVWRRPRFPWWPFTRRLLRCDLKPDKPIPVPGKGENSWDQGDDATYSMTCKALKVGEALGILYDSVARQRERYGSGMREYVKRDPVY